MNDQPQSNTSPRDDLIWIIGLWLVLGAIHSPVLAGVVTYFHDDLWAWFLPVHDFLRHELWRGNLLPWCPYVSCGYPLSAEPQTGIFYPLNLLLALPLPINVVMGLALWVHYGLAATGAYALARRFGANGLGSFTGALVFSASGFMVAHLHHYAIISAAAWFPWAWYAGYSYRLRPRRRWLVWLWWCSAAQLLAGQPQVWLLTFGSLLVWLLLAEGLLPQMKQARPQGWSLAARWALPMAAALLGVGLAGITLLPARELLNHSVRSLPTLDFITSYPLSRATLCSFVGWHIATGDAWEFEGFAGLVTLALAGLAMFRGKARPPVLLLLTMVLFAFIMGLSPQNPLYRLILHLPVLNAFRCSARWLLIISGCLSLLAGWMLTELTDTRRWLTVALAGVLACEVMLFAIRYNPVLPAASLRPPEYWADLVLDKGRLASLRPPSLPENARAQYEVGRRLLLPNLSLLWHMPAMDGYMPLQLREFDRLRPVDPENHPQRAALLGAMTLLAPTGSRPAEGWDLQSESDGVGIYRNRYYRGWCWLEKPGGGDQAKGIAYSYYDGRYAWAAQCASDQPNRVVFSFIYGPWLTATVNGTPVPLEKTREGLCAVSFTGNASCIALIYHHPRLREGLVTSGAAFYLFIVYLFLISYFRKRSNHGFPTA